MSATRPSASYYLWRIARQKPRLSLASVGLYSLLLASVANDETDGVVSDDVLRVLGGDSERADLIDRGLLQMQADGDGYLPDWAEYARDRAHQQSNRKASRLRVEKFRSDQLGRLEQARNGVTNGASNEAGNGRPLKELVNVNVTEPERRNIHRNEANEAPAVAAASAPKVASAPTPPTGNQASRRVPTFVSKGKRP